MTRLLPDEPTEEMMRAAIIAAGPHGIVGYIQSIYHAMLSSAPPSPVLEGEDAELVKELLTCVQIYPDGSEVPDDLCRKAASAISRLSAGAGQWMPKLEWEDNYLYLGKIRIGEVYSAPPHLSGPWRGCVNNTFVSGFPTPDLARAAVEAALREAIGQGGKS